MPSDAEMARIAIAFLERANLSGQEIEAYVTVRSWLQNMTQPPQENVKSVDDD